MVDAPGEFVKMSCYSLKTVKKTTKSRKCI